MGIFFVSLGIGGYLSGKLASLTAIPHQALSVAALKAHYATSFSHLVIILVVAALGCVVLNRIICRLMRSAAEEDVAP